MGAEFGWCIRDDIDPDAYQKGIAEVGQLVLRWWDSTTGLLRERAEVRVNGGVTVHVDPIGVFRLPAYDELTRGRGACPSWRCGHVKPLAQSFFDLVAAALIVLLDAVGAASVRISTSFITSDTVQRGAELANRLLGREYASGRTALLAAV